MICWGFYFISKTVLYLGGHLKFDPWLNALLALFVLMPLKTGKLMGWTPGKKDPTRSLHRASGIPLALMLVWHESYLPSFTKVQEFLGDPAIRPSLRFQLEFLASRFSQGALLGGAVIFCAAFFLSRLKRAWIFHVILPVLAALIHRGWSVSNHSAPRPELLEIREPAPELADRIEPLSPDARPFDLILLQVCSLSLDDLSRSGSRNHRFFSNFDAFFTSFNTRTSYSTPAALRLLRSNCAQASNDSLYRTAPPECLLLENLREAGFATSTVFNHEGPHARKMAEELKRFAAADLPMPLRGLEPSMTGYSGEPVYKNDEVLERWWKQRLESKAQSSALFYNTISLHAGNHFLNRPGKWWERKPLEAYGSALEATLGELDSFFRTLERSGRDSLVIMVSEHGANLAGSTIQGPDLREIPLPAITLVPMGVKWIGKGWKAGPRFETGQTVSYPELVALVRQTIRQRNRTALSRATAVGTPPLIAEKGFFAENENSTVVSGLDGLYYRGADRNWWALPEEVSKEQPL